MKFIRVLKASDWKVEKISETDWVIKSPDGTYKNSNGKDYHFKTKEDALEELDYLRAEHEGDEKAKDIKSAKIDNWNQVRFDSIPGGMELSILHNMYEAGFIFRLGCFSGGKLDAGYYYPSENKNDDEMIEIAKQLMPKLEQVASEFDNKIKELMRSVGFEDK